jgi:hypothetical protein
MKSSLIEMRVQSSSRGRFENVYSAKHRFALIRRRRKGSLKVRTNNRVKVLSDRSTGLSVAEGNCVVERRGGEQPEANDQSINKTMMNSIRPDALASLHQSGEAKNGNRPGRESGHFATYLWREQ